jgi:predicted transcriptional regulator
MYNNQVMVLNEKVVPISQLQICDLLGYSKNKVNQIFGVLQKGGCITAVGRGKYKLSDEAISMIEMVEKIDKKLQSSNEKGRDKR